MKDTAAGRSYYQVPLSNFRVDEVTDFNIYLQSDENKEPVLYRHKNLTFTAEVMERLREHHVEYVYIDYGDKYAYEVYLESHLGEILDDPDVSPERKSTVLYGSLTHLVEDLIAEPRAAEVVSRSKQMVENSCKFLFNEEASLKHMMQVCSFDYYTYTHSVNVFVFATALGAQFYPQEYISGDFGLGALLHDIGKHEIPDSILNCPGKLTDEQFTVMKGHPGIGYDILKEKNEVSDIVLNMVRHHHEKLEGGGYPDNLSGEEICREVRILTIADIFDALTTQRSYKDAMPSFKALQLMKQEMTRQLDPDLFNVFIHMMGGN